MQASPQTDFPHVQLLLSTAAHEYDEQQRLVKTTRRMGAMETTESTVYDVLGRISSQTDVLGRTTTSAYSMDGLTTTVSTTAGASLTTVRNTDSSVAHDIRGRKVAEWGTGILSLPACRWSCCLLWSAALRPSLAVAHPVGSDPAH